MFQKVEVLQALKWAIDYDAIAKNITPNVWNVWQSVLPKGVPGAISDKPFKKDVAKAKALLAQAGYPDGFTVTLDHFSTAPYRDIAQAIQADLAASASRCSCSPASTSRSSARCAHGSISCLADLVPGLPGCQLQHAGVHGQSG